MIAPIWADFPESGFKGRTSILLELVAGYNADELVSEIKCLDPKLLMFLRKPKQVSIKSYEKSGKIVRSTLGSHDAPIGEDGQQIVNLHHNAAVSSFKVRTIYRYCAKYCAQTEILLTFPLSQSGEP
jgi:hypothetical protein